MYQLSLQFLLASPRRLFADILIRKASPSHSETTLENPPPSSPLHAHVVNFLVFSVPSIADLYGFFLNIENLLFLRNSTLQYFNVVGSSLSDFSLSNTLLPFCPAFLTSFLRQGSWSRPSALPVPPLHLVEPRQRTFTAKSFLFGFPLHHLAAALCQLQNILFSIFFTCCVSHLGAYPICVCPYARFSLHLLLLRVTILTNVETTTKIVAPPHANLSSPNVAYLDHEGFISISISGDLPIRLYHIPLAPARVFDLLCPPVFASRVSPARRKSPPCLLSKPVKAHTVT